jgi:hypothetical protein
MFEWFSEWWLSVQTWLSDAVDSLLVYLDPSNLWAWAINRAADMLPPAADLSPFLDPLRYFVGSLAPIYQYADYWVNMPLLSLAAGIMLTTELALGAPRLWRFIRSFVT